MRRCTWLLCARCHCCVFTHFVCLRARLSTLHAQVSVSLDPQWCVLPTPSRCVDGLTNGIIMWGRAAGHVDMEDLWMALTIALRGFCATSWLQCNGRESWQPASGCSDTSQKSWGLRGATDRQMFVSRFVKQTSAVNIHTTAQNSKARRDYMKMTRIHKCTVNINLYHLPSFHGPNWNFSVCQARCWPLYFCLGWFLVTKFRCCMLIYKTIGKKQVGANRSWTIYIVIITMSWWDYIQS